ETNLGYVRRDGAHLVYEAAAEGVETLIVTAIGADGRATRVERTFRVLAQSEPGRDPLPVPQMLTWATPIWASVLRRNGAHVRGVFDGGGVVDRRESVSVPLGTVTQGALGTQEPPVSPLPATGVSSWRAEIVASECVWSVGSPALAGDQPAIVEVEWVGKGPL